MIFFLIPTTSNRKFANWKKRRKFVWLKRKSQRKCFWSIPELSFTNQSLQSHIYAYLNNHLWIQKKKNNHLWVTIFINYLANYRSVTYTLCISNNLTNSCWTVSWVGILLNNVWRHVIVALCKLVLAFLHLCKLRVMSYSDPIKGLVKLHERSIPWWSLSELLTPRKFERII